MGRPQHIAVKVEPPPPGPSDVLGWHEAVRNGSFRACRLEDVVIALQDLRPALGKPTEHALAKHLSDCMIAILRGLVGTHHPNNGEDIIEEVHTVLWTALLKPDSPDGKGLRKAFTPRLKFRLLDVLRRVETEESAATELNPEVHSLNGLQFVGGVGPDAPHGGFGSSSFPDDDTWACFRRQATRSPPAPRAASGSTSRFEPLHKEQVLTCINSVSMASGATHAEFLSIARASRAPN